jgi:hypothetical protein
VERGGLRYDSPLVNTAALRTLVIYAVTLPLAIFVGWMVAGDMTRTSFAVLVAIVFVLLLPVLLKWHYPVMVFSWGTFITIFFLPGEPALWMLMAGINFGIAILNRILQKRQAFLSAPSITASLLVFTAIILITAKLRGGIGMHALGSNTYGGKGYVFILAAIVGYFALTSQPIPAERANLYVALFFLSSLVTGVSNLIYLAGPSFYFLFSIFPVGFAAMQAASEAGGHISRIAGFGVATSSVGFYLFAVHGVRGTLRRWWRVLLLLLVLVLGMLSGFRSNLVLFGTVFAVLFVVEGLLRSPIFPALLLLGVLAFAVVAPFSLKLPTSMQRTLSILPIEIDPVVRADAKSSLDWRFEMWRSVVPDLPKYIWLGKGYSQNATDLYLTQQAVLRHRQPGYAGAIFSGDYHSGPLSLYVTFGSFGSLAFIGFVAVSIRGLYLNYRYGSEQLCNLNRFLFAYFCARLIFFITTFGALAYDFYFFTGTIGLSVALNRGICRKPAVAPKPVRFRGDFELRASQSGTV